MKTTENFVDICREVEMTIGFIKVLHDKLRRTTSENAKPILDDLRLRLFEATSELVNIPEQFLPLPDIKNLLLCFIGGVDHAKMLHENDQTSSFAFRQTVLIRNRLRKIARKLENQAEM